jgi:hypothetical protein
MLRRWLLAAALIAASPHQAQAQATVLQTGPWTPNHVPAYSTTGGTSQPLIFDSGPAAGGVAGTGISELNITQLGTPSSIYGTPFCINDAPSASSTGFHQFCFGANSQGGGLFSYNAYGGASPLPLHAIINGSEYQFPFSVTSAIQGPNSSTINDIVTWNNTGGTLVKDSGIGISQVALLSGAVFTGRVTVPALADTGNPSIATSPTGNPTSGSLLTTLSSLQVQGSTVSLTNREFLANIGLTSSTGNGVSNNNGDKVALYVGASGKSGTGALWASNILIDQTAGSGTYNAQGIELDMNNENADRGGSDGPSGLPSTIANALSISGANLDGALHPNTANLALDSFGGSGGTGALFAHAITMSGQFKYNEIADYAQAPTFVAIFGGHTYGIDGMQGSFTGGMIRLAAGVTGGIVGRNSGNTADVSVLDFDGTNEIVCGAGCAGFFVGGPVTPSATGTYDMGGPSALWNTIYAQTLSLNTALVSGGTSLFAGTAQFTALSGGSPAKYACFDSSGFLVASSSAC